MKDHKGMIAYIAVTLVIGLFVTYLGADMFLSEQTSVRWLGIFMGGCGALVVLTAWVWGSALHFGVTQKEAWWGIKNFLPKRYTQ